MWVRFLASFAGFVTISIVGFIFFIVVGFFLSGTLWYIPLMLLAAGSGYFLPVWWRRLSSRSS